MNWHDVPSLAALRAFEAAARHGSLSVAARDLNVTHAAIGQHVRALEDHFGMTLLERDGRGMAPTPDGQALADTLTEAFGLIASASADLLDRGTSRALRVAVTPSLAANWLMPRIGRFWDSHPDIELELIPSTRLVDLRGDGIDVAIRYGRGGWTGATSQRLMAAGHMAAAAPAYLKGREVDCLADLKGARWIMDGHRSEETLWMAENGIDLEAESVTILPSAHLVREAVASGNGITVLPAPILAPEINTGRLVALCVEENSALGYHVLTRPEVVSPSRDVFVKWLMREAAN